MKMKFRRLPLYLLGGKNIIIKYYVLDHKEQIFRDTDMLHAAGLYTFSRTRIKAMKSRYSETEG